MNIAEHSAIIQMMKFTLGGKSMKKRQYLLVAVILAMGILAGCGETAPEVQNTHNAGAGRADRKYG